MSFTTTDRALELAKLGEGCRILDIGCGEGDVVAYLTEKCGMEAEGIDMNLEKIRIAKENHPGIDVKFGDGEFLEDYSSFTFDGIFMQDVLALINLPDEALHEAYCVLKKGGRLVIIDDYYTDPDPKQLRALQIEAARLSKKPRKEGDCEADPVRFVDFRFKDTFFIEPLKRQIEEIGYKVAAFEALEPADADGRKQSARDAKGRFLMIAEKPL